MKIGMCLVSVVAVASTVLWVAAPASASHVQCGDVITANTTLDSDVVCGDEFQQYGLAIGADNVILKMKDYAIRGGAGGGVAGISGASPDEDGLQGVQIKRGSIEGFLSGIQLNADDTTLFKVDITTFDNQDFAGDNGITLLGDRNSVLSSTVNTTGDGGSGIDMFGDDAYAWGNVVTANPESSFGHLGISAIGDRPRLVYNRVEGCGPPGTGSGGVAISGYTGDAVVNRNTVTGCSVGVSVQADTTDVGGARVTLNEATGSGVGISVADAFARVGGNLAQDAGDTGILLDLPGTTVRNNRAFNNGNYGIYGPEGTVDGGGNVAAGNGDGTNPQCVNVECSEPPPPT